ncbi:MAG: folylpolyglutamate synthase/dihydrofolate synthase family protein [Salinivirgaceae bacterium]
MDYQQTIDFLFSQLPVFQREGKAAYKDNLDNTLALDAYFNHPHKKFKTIHVAGTNGKGSVSHMIASVLQESGLKTGLYTSPHLTDFRERIKVNGMMMDKDSVVEFVNSHKRIIEELKPSFFELTVAMAFNYFAREQVDVAVIEVGMGGRLDSTNIIKPVLSIITNIGLDHTQFLGTTLEQIAREKAGIIKDQVPVIIGTQQDETAPVFEEIAIARNAPLCFASKRFYISKAALENDLLHLAIKNKQSGTTLELELDLLGNYQKDNLLTVMAAMQILIPMFDIPKSTVVTGLKKVVKNTGLNGRWQVIQKKPLIICDTGHNYDGIAFIVNQLANETYDKLHIVFGMVNDKDPSAVLNLLPRNAIYYFTKASIPRALNHVELMETAKYFNLHGEAYPTVADAVSAAKRQLNENDLLFVGGSTFVVADFLGSL